MNRLTYISSFSKSTSLKDIREIGRISEVNNARDNLTGVLLCFRGVFYQIIEGEERDIDRCFERIKADPRHDDIFILNIEKNISHRMYVEWKMKTVFLDDQKYPLIMPIRNLLDSLTKTHQILTQYVPKEILKGIQSGSEPQTWGFKREDLVVMFSDLLCFTTITEKIDLPGMQELLYTYFEIASKNIQDSGGSIGKLTGDGFMAYYPIEKANAALQAGAGIIKALGMQRKQSGSPFVKLAYCGIGISAGTVVQGNVGSTKRQDYTLLGDVVNSASRLESYTRETGHALLFDQGLHKYLRQEDQFNILDLGEHMLKGKTKKSQIYTLDDPELLFDKSTAEIATAIGDIQM
ncbi:MAG: BLUF domain-containing protein [Bacteroidota bacterium]